MQTIRYNPYFWKVNRSIITLLFIVVSAAGQAQIGGRSAFSFIALQPNARIAALGGTAISIVDNDMNLAIQNPSMLRKEMDNQITYNHVFLFESIGSGFVGFTKHYDSIGTFTAGIQYINYGDFKRTTPNGDVIGSFNAGEYCMNIGYGKKLSDYFSVGGQVKLIYSSLADYTALGLAIDGGMTYNNEKRLFAIAATANNIGQQFKGYTQGFTENLPTNIRLAFSKKFKHNPFRFTIAANHLERAGKLLYQNNNRPGTRRDLETGEVIPEKFSIAERTISHLTVSSEVLFGKYFYLALGYNYLRRYEMQLDDVGGFTGFTWGFGLKVKKIQLAYGNSGYYVGRGSNHLSFIVNLNDFKKKKKASS